MAKTAKSTNDPAAVASDDEDFRLHSLQEAHAKDRRYAANDEELLHFYEQMLLIRRFEESEFIKQCNIIKEPAPIGADSPVGISGCKKCQEVAARLIADRVQPARGIGPLDQVKRTLMMRDEMANLFALLERNIHTP